MSKLLCICGSAGSIETITYILKNLNKKYKVPIIILVHVERNRVSSLAEVIQNKTQKKICIPNDLEKIKQGNVYVVPSLYHTQIERNHTFSFTMDEPVNFSRPSIDILLETAAWAYQENLTAVILSGASGDGAKGSQIVENYGGRVIIQNPDETPFKTMIEKALLMTKNALVLSKENIIKYINNEKDDFNG